MCNNGNLKVNKFIVDKKRESGGFRRKEKKRKALEAKKGQSTLSKFVKKSESTAADKLSQESEPGNSDPEISCIDIDDTSTEF